MTKGDKLIGTKRTYNGIEFRSGLECQFANILDLLNIKWEYEPKKFYLSNRIWYIPDFYLTELKTWVEVKGKIEKDNKKISKIFAEDNKTTMILISYSEWYWYSMGDFIDGVNEDSDLQIGFCSNCKSYFFCSNIGSYHCRKCENYDGDHDIIMFSNNGFEDLELLIKKVKKDGDSLQKI